MTERDRHRLLVVEDDPEIQYIISVVLAADDREIVSATTGAEARAALETGGIDLVVLDLILPDVDGRSLLSELRCRPDTAVVPVVVVTARAGPETRHDCYALGADYFVEKPFDPEGFADAIKVQLARAARAERAALADPLTGLLNRAGLAAAAAEASGEYGVGLIQLDRFGLLSERWGWDQTEDVVKEVAHALRAGVPDEVELCRIGGGDFALLVRGGDRDSIHRHASKALEVVKELRLEAIDPDAPQLTATIGVQIATPEMPLDEALDSARQKIFQARAKEGDHVAMGDGPPEPQGGHVLVAEDDEISATILLHRLDKEGLDVLRFDNGQDAYQDALRETPVLVILDVKMPGLDGFEVLERLRKDPRFSSVPIIMLTSMGQEADVVRAFRMGADDYILKPFSPTELSARVRRLLTRGRSEASL